MKKIILSIVFVFTAIIFVIAGTPVECYESAENAVYLANEDSRTWYGTGWLTYEEEYEVFLASYEECMVN